MYSDSTGGEISQRGRTHRNLLILPCDNGLCVPNYDALEQDIKGIPLRKVVSSSKDPFIKDVTSNQLVIDRFTNDVGNISYDSVSLRNYLTRSFTSPNDLGEKYAYFPVSHLTEDIDSNDVTLFNIPSLYYGERIHPGTLTVKDLDVSGSNKRMSITVKDDGRGSLYRADALTPHAKWASIGNVFYDEGLVLYKTPHPPYFGKSAYSLDFKGEQTTHVMSLSVPCERETFTSSSNPTYRVMSASNDAKDKDNPFVYITDINIHDDNLNIIMKASLAQPVVKRETDSFSFRIKKDF